MNTNTKQDQKKNRRPKTRQQQGLRKLGQSRNMLHEGLKNQDHEHPETRLTR